MTGQDEIGGRRSGWVAGSSWVERARWIVELLAIIALIGWLDLITGAEVGFALFYLVPIALAGWRMGRTPAILGAVFSALAWFIADIHWRRTGGWGVSLWNGSSRLVIFVAMGWLTARVSADAALTKRLLDDALRVARTDPLTGIPNSRSFFESLRARLGPPAPQRIALVYCDVDNFKIINDTEGHERGDALLRDIAAVLARRAGPSDIAARLGGDEFALVLFDREPSEVDAVVAGLVADTEEIGRRHPGAGLSLSAGVVHALGVADADDLVRDADRAMYVVKNRRKTEPGRSDGSLHDV